MTFDFFEAFKPYPGLRCRNLYSLFLTIRDQTDDLESLVNLYNTICSNADDFSKLTPTQRQDFRNFLEFRIKYVIQRINEINQRQSLLNEEDSGWEDCEFDLDDANKAKHDY